MHRHTLMARIFGILILVSALMAVMAIPASADDKCPPNTDNEYRKFEKDFLKDKIDLLAKEIFLAKLCLDRDSKDSINNECPFKGDLKDICEKIVDKKTKEFNTLQYFLKDNYGDFRKPKFGKCFLKDVEELKYLQGKDFAIELLLLLIRLELKDIRMLEDAKDKVYNPYLKDNIEKFLYQERELLELKKDLLCKLFCDKPNG